MILRALVSVDSVVTRVVKPVVTEILVAFKLDVVFVIFVIAIEITEAVEVAVAMFGMVTVA